MRKRLAVPFTVVLTLPDGTAREGRSRFHAATVAGAKEAAIAVKILLGVEGRVTYEAWKHEANASWSRGQGQERPAGVAHYTGRL